MELAREMLVEALAWHRDLPRPPLSGEDLATSWAWARADGRDPRALRRRVHRRGRRDSLSARPEPGDEPARNLHRFAPRYGWI
jgi:hypothetical protein